MTKTKHHKAHDLLFAEVFSRKESAASFIKNFAQKELVENLDLGSLQIQPTSYVKAKLKRAIADLVFRCGYADEEMEICIIKEHKSSPPKDPHFQLLEYIQEKWRQEKKDKKKRTPVVCILLYHGNEKWKYKPMRDYIPGMDDLLAPYNPLFNFILVDLSEYSDEFILGLDTLFLVNSLLLLKHSGDEEYIRHNYEAIFVYAEQYAETPEGLKFINSLVVYITKTTELSAENILEITEKSPKLKHSIMQGYTLLDWAKEEWKEEARAEGLEKGFEKGFTKKDFKLVRNGWEKKLTPEFIAEFCEIPIKKVKKIIAELEAEKKKKKNGSK